MRNIEVVESLVDNTEIRRVRNSLKRYGYAHTSNVALGLSENFHEPLDRHFFKEEFLGPEMEGVPVPDRTRCRDVVECRFDSDCLTISEYKHVALRPVANATAPRLYKHTYTLDVPLFVKWLVICLSLIPAEERQTHCTVGLEFMRTRGKVVGYKHQDHEQFVCIYIVAREAEGALTSLHPISDPDKTEMAVTLKPGELLIFRDCDFVHDATPLQPRFDGDQPHRDTIIALMHYPTTYLNPVQ